MNSPLKEPVSKTFKLHPSIIYSVIREQAGDPVKALVELVMNSIDAGATKTKITLDAERFTIEDNGRGFENTESIEKFFGTFGTPHKEGDALYGKFRIGRGQCYSIAKTEWRSGKHGMHVDLGNHKKTDEHGYVLFDFDEYFSGCVIKGEFYKPLNIHEHVQNVNLFNDILNKKLNEFNDSKTFDFSVFTEYDFFSRLMRSIAFIDTEISINNITVTGGSRILPIYENEEAKFYVQNKRGLFDDVFLNKGVFICEGGGWTPLLIDFKKSPNLNLARNQINSACPILKSVIEEKYKIIFDGFMRNEKWASSAVYSLISYIQNECSKINPLIKYMQSKDSIIFEKHINSENIVDALNKVKIKKYKAGKISSVGLFDVVLEISKNPSEFLVSNEKQNFRFQINSKKIMQNYLVSTGCNKTIIFDEFGVIQVPMSDISDEINHLEYEDYYSDINMDLFGTFLIYLNKTIFTQFDFKLLSHNYVEGEHDYSQYKSSENKNNVTEKDYSELKSPREKAVAYFESKGIISVYDKARHLSRVEKTENAIFNFVNNFKKLFSDVFIDNSETHSVEWTLFDKQNTNILIVSTSSVAADIYEDECYIFLTYKDLMQCDPLFEIFKVLFNKPHHSLYVDILKEKNNLSMREEIYRSVYDDFEHNKSFHDNLDIVFSDHKMLEFIDAFLNDFYSSWENGFVKLSLAEKKLTKETLRVVELMPFEFQESILNFECVQKISLN